MAVEPFVAAIIALSAGALFGAANSIFGWLKNNEPFDTRKFAITTITGIIAGVALVFSQLSGIINATDNLELLTQIVALGIMVFGANEIRTFISGAVANRAEEQVKESEEEEQPTQ